MHTVAALHSYTHTTYFGQILVFWVTYGVKWCHYVMIEPVSHLKLLPTSILDMYIVFEHIGMLSIGIH